MENEQTVVEIINAIQEDLNTRYGWNLSYRASLILYYISQKRIATQSEICLDLQMAVKTVRHNVRKLAEDGLLIRVPNLNDMRSTLYVIASEVTIKDMGELKYETKQNQENSR
jgi:DNA-binding MarR family transcriptional regulator